MHIHEQWREKRIADKREMAIDTKACLNWFHFWNELNKVSSEIKCEGNTSDSLVYVLMQYCLMEDKPFRSRLLNLSLSGPLHAVIQFPLLMGENWECSYVFFQVTKLQDFLYFSYPFLFRLPFAFFKNQNFEHSSVFALETFLREFPFFTAKHFAFTPRQDFSTRSIVNQSLLKTPSQDKTPRLSSLRKRS